MVMRVFFVLVSVTWVVMIVVIWVTDCCGLVGTVDGAPLVGAVSGAVLGAVLGALDAPPEAVELVPEPGVDAPPEGTDEALPLGPDGTAAPLLLGAPAVDAVSVPPVALALALAPPLAPVGSEVLPAMTVVVVFEDGPAVVEEPCPWTA